MPLSPSGCGTAASNSRRSPGCYRGEATIALTALSETPLQWVAAAAFSGPEAQIRAVATRGGVMVQAYLTGDGQADFQLFVENVVSLAVTDFALL